MDWIDLFFNQKQKKQARKQHEKLGIHSIPNKGKKEFDNGK